MSICTGICSTAGHAQVPVVDSRRGPLTLWVHPSRSPPAAPVFSLLLLGWSSFAPRHAEGLAWEGGAVGAASTLDGLWSPPSRGPSSPSLLLSPTGASPGTHFHAPAIQRRAPTGGPPPGLSLDDSNRSNLGGWDRLCQCQQCSNNDVKCTGLIKGLADGISSTAAVRAFQEA